VKKESFRLSFNDQDTVNGGKNKKRETGRNLRSIFKLFSSRQRKITINFSPIAVAASLLFQTHTFLCIEIWFLIKS
jgi:hypothetical protein